MSERLVSNRKQAEVEYENLFEIKTPPDQYSSQAVSKVPLNSEMDELGSEIISEKTNRREVQLRRQQGLLKLCDTFKSNKVVSNSKATVGIFDILKEHSARVGKLFQKAQTRRELIYVKYSLDKLRQYRRYQKVKRRKQWKADKFNELRIQVFQKRVFIRIRQVLSFEHKWIKDVQYQFAFGLREEAFQALRMNVAY